MARTDYTVLDDLIVDAIRRGNRRHADILREAVCVIEWFCYDEMGRYRRSTNQVLDNRLQYLKKKGRVSRRVDGMGWIEGTVEKWH